MVFFFFVIDTKTKYRTLREFYFSGRDLSFIRNAINCSKNVQSHKTKFDFQLVKPFRFHARRTFSAQSECIYYIVIHSYTRRIKTLKKIAYVRRRLRGERKTPRVRFNRPRHPFGGSMTTRSELLNRDGSHAFRRPTDDDGCGRHSIYVRIMYIHSENCLKRYRVGLTSKYVRVESRLLPFVFFFVFFF